MNNDKTKSRQRKGREPSEKTAFIRRYVRRWLCLNQLRYTATICRLVAPSALGCFHNSTNSWLANQESSEMERIR